MSPPLPMVGSGEPVSRAVDALEKAGAAVVLVDGRPSGMITRQDVLDLPGRPSAGRDDPREMTRPWQSDQCVPMTSADVPELVKATTELSRNPDGFETLAIHAGQEPDPLTGAVVPPIYQVSTYKQDGVGGLRGGYEYSRTANPTRTALEECLAALEGGRRALAFASGMAAEDCLLRTICAPGDHVLIPDDAYGGTYRLVAKVLAEWGVSYRPVPISDIAAVADALAERPARVLWVETPTNPLLSIADITALAGRAPARRARCSWWTTRSPPRTCSSRSRSARTRWSTRPPSTWAATPTWSAARWWSPTRRSASGWPSCRTRPARWPGPFDAWLTLRGIKTLAVRMDRHSRTRPGWRTCWPRTRRSPRCSTRGCRSHPGHEVAAKQMRGFGGMVSFRVRGGEEAPSRSAAGPGCSRWASRSAGWSR